MGQRVQICQVRFENSGDFFAPHLRAASLLHVALSSKLLAEKVPWRWRRRRRRALKFGGHDDPPFGSEVTKGKFVPLGRCHRNPSFTLALWLFSQSEIRSVPPRSRLRPRRFTHAAAPPLRGIAKSSGPPKPANSRSEGGRRGDRQAHTFRLGLRISRHEPRRRLALDPARSACASSPVPRRRWDGPPSSRRDRPWSPPS